MNDVNPYSPTAEVASDPFGYDASGQKLATRGERFLGALIDWIIQLILVLPLAIGLGIFVGMQMSESRAASLIAELAGGVMGVVIFLAVNGYLLATQGRTVGKMVMKTRIVDRNTNQIQPFWPLILKRYSWLWLLTLIPIVGGIIPLIDALMIFRANIACLHDDVANTKVIKG